MNQDQKSRVADGDLKTARDLAAIVAAVGQLKESWHNGGSRGGWIAMHQ